MQACKRKRDGGIIAAFHYDFFQTYNVSVSLLIYPKRLSDAILKKRGCSPAKWKQALQKGTNTDEAKDA